MYEQFTKEQLAEQANKARHVAIDLAAKIYEYIAGDISKDQLKASVKELLSESVETLLYHKIILKDYLDIDKIDDECNVDDSDIEEMVINDI